MKYNRFPILSIAPLSLFAFVVAGCTAQEPNAIGSVPSSPESIVGPTTPAPTGGATLFAATSSAQVAPGAADRIATNSGVTVEPIPRWIDLERLTYAMRDQFLTGVSRLDDVVTAQVADVAARRAAMTHVPSTADSQAWEAAMKEMDDARSYLKSMIKEAAAATEDTWRQKQEKVGQAWARTQAIYEKVDATFTR